MKNIKSIIYIILLFCIWIQTSFSAPANIVPWENSIHGYTIQNNFSCSIKITRVKKCYFIENVNPVWNNILTKINWGVSESSNNLNGTSSSPICKEYEPNYLIEKGNWFTDTWWGIEFFTKNSIIWAKINSSFEYDFDIKWNCSEDWTSNTSIISTSNVVWTINWSCWIANNTTINTAPTSNLCSTGDATTVLWTWPWTWSCTGLWASPTTASCNANTTILPPVPNSCATPPTFANIWTTTTWTPTSVNQAWTYSTTPWTCTYQCDNWYTWNECTTILPPVTPPPWGWWGWWSTYQCYDTIKKSWDKIKCVWNSRAKSFWVICDSITDWSSLSDTVWIFKTKEGSENWTNYANFDCSTWLNTPICFVYDDERQRSYWSKTWRTSQVCKTTNSITSWGGSSSSCWNGKIEGIEQCEANTSWIFPASCNTTTCQFNLTTYPNHGEIDFVGTYDMVLGHNQNLGKKDNWTDRLNNELYIWNKSDYTFSNSLFNWVCLTEANVVWSNWIDIHKNTWDSILPLWNTKCTNITTNFYPNQKIYLKKDLSGIIADKSKVWSDDYEDNKLVLTVRTTTSTAPYSKILNWSDHLTGKFRVRVAKPAVQTTGGTSFTKNWVSSNSNKIAEGWGINLEWWTTNNLKNNNDVWVWTKSSSSNTTNDTRVVKDADDYSNDSSIIEDTTQASFTNYNGLDNVFIMKWNISMSSIDYSTITEATTYIIDWNLIIDENVDNVPYNIAFVIKWWNNNIIINNDIETITWTYIVLDSWKIKWAESAKQLIVKGSLYWDISNLVDNRYFFTENNWELTFGTVVSFGSTVFQKPAPLVTSFINTYLKTSKVAK